MKPGHRDRLLSAQVHVLLDTDTYERLIVCVGSGDTISGYVRRLIERAVCDAEDRMLRELVMAEFGNQS